MAKRALKFRKAAFEELRNDPRIAKFLLDKAEKLAAEAGGEAMGYKVTELVLEESRAATSVMATGHAHFHNRKHHALLRSLDSVREV
jgi:hypothetical protein